MRFHVGAFDSLGRGEFSRGLDFNEPSKEAKKPGPFPGGRLKRRTGGRYTSPALRQRGTDLPVPTDERLGVASLSPDKEENKDANKPGPLPEERLERRVGDAYTSPGFQWRNEERGVELEFPKKPLEGAFENRLFFPW